MPRARKAVVWCGTCVSCHATTTTVHPKATSRASGNFSMDCPNCDGDMTMERRPLEDLRRELALAASGLSAGDAFLDQVGVYLASIGWKALVAGPVQVQQQPHDEGSMRFELVVRFTGGRQKK